MTMQSEERIETGRMSGCFAKILEVVFFVFLVSFFLTAGSDTQEFYVTRFYFGIILILSFLLYYRKKLWPIPGRSPTFILFLCFLSYEILRALWGFYFLRSGPVEEPVGRFLRLYTAAPKIWFFYFVLFAVSFTFFSTRRRVWHLFLVMTCAAAFLALNAIPSLLMQGEGKFGYLLKDGQHVFFAPFFYFHETISRYFIAQYAPVNWVGDVMGLGLFAALGLAFYTYERIRKEKKEEEKDLKLWPLFLLECISVFVIASAIVLLLARGTIISVTAGVLVCFAAIPFKFPSRSRVRFTVWMLIAIVGFLFWAGNLQRAWRETQTVTREFTPEVAGTLSETVDGIQRSIAIFRDHFPWGIGTDGYHLVGRYYGKPKMIGILVPLANFQAMCHYFQVLAEEGVGALIYWMFLGAYFFEVISGLVRTRSRFKFIAGLAFFCATLSLFIHAAVHHLLAVFPVASMAYMVMGATLGVFYSDFDNPIAAR